MGCKFSQISQEPYIFMIQYTSDFHERISDLRTGMQTSFPKAQVNSYRVTGEQFASVKQSSCCQVWVVDVKGDRDNNDSHSKSNSKRKSKFQPKLVYQQGIGQFNEEDLVQRLKEIRG